MNEAIEYESARDFINSTYNKDTKTECFLDNIIIGRFSVMKDILSALLTTLTDVPIIQLEIISPEAEMNGEDPLYLLGVIEHKDNYGIICYPTDCDEICEILDEEGDCNIYIHNSCIGELDDSIGNDVIPFRIKGDDVSPASKILEISKDITGNTTGFLYKNTVKVDGRDYNMSCSFRSNAPGMADKMLLSLFGDKNENK